MPTNKKAEQLADFIEKHPSCLFNIDNDAWYILKANVDKPDDIKDYEENQIADDSDYQWETDWYAHSSNYGAGLAEALVILLNRRGFNIKAEAV